MGHFVALSLKELITDVLYQRTDDERRLHFLCLCLAGIWTYLSLTRNPTP